MPRYSYHCPQCGDFTVQQSMNEQHDTFNCPTCDTTAQRVFQAFQTYHMNQKLKKRIERGQEPRVMTKNQLPTMRTKTFTGGRPWMAGH